MYEIFDCGSNICQNQGFSCWRDPDRKRHFKLDSVTMGKVVDFAEEGNKLENHNDLPQRIREIIYKHDEEETARKQLKRKASDQGSSTLRICCHGHQDDACGDSTPNPHKGPRRQGPEKLLFPMPMDEAPVIYRDWLCSKVTNEMWRKAYKLACKVNLEKGYHLGRMHEAQLVDAKMLAANGVLQGIALQFVSRVKEWLDKMYPGHVDDA